MVSVGRRNAVVNAPSLSVDEWRETVFLYRTLTLSCHAL